MKKLIYPFLFVFAFACDRDDSPNPNATPSIEKLAKQQAPFGAAASDVKLKKVLQGNQLSVEYIYEGDLLSEERRHDASNYLEVYQKGKFVRVDNLPETYTVSTAYHDAQGDSATTYNPVYTLSFTKPKSDSIRQVMRETSDKTQKNSTYYSFDKDGYITKQEFWNDMKANLPYAIGMYVRDARHNVVKTLERVPGQPAPENWIEYTYDNNPNPFFKIGRDWGGDMSVRSLSPNNLAKETHRNSVGITSNIYYTYDYLPNGYPKKVTIRVESVNYAPFSYSLDFEY